MHNMRSELMGILVVLSIWCGPDGIWSTLANPAQPSPFNTVAEAVAAGGGRSVSEILYNGIMLPHTWPPAYGSVPYAPMPVPYLGPENLPAVIPIDVGRQLFVDNFLIASTTMIQTYHQASYYAQNPVLKPGSDLEINGDAGAYAGPFSGGSWYDPNDGLFKLWYQGAPDTTRYGGSTHCYATSVDGKNWDRPNLGVNPVEVELLDHFTCIPSNPGTNDQVTINAYDENDQQVNLDDWDSIEFCFAPTGYVCDESPTVELLHHFTCTPSNPGANDRVTINAYDENDQQVNLGDWDIIEFCFKSGRAGCVETGNGSVTIDRYGGAVFTVTQTMLDAGIFDFWAYKENAPPESIWFPLPFPFDTASRGDPLFPFVKTGGGGITIDGNGGAVFTVTQPMIDNNYFRFNAYKQDGPPENEYLLIPFPFDTMSKAGNSVYPFAGDKNRIDCTSVVLDHNGDASERFKWFSTDRNETTEQWNLTYRISSDGIHWSTPQSEVSIWGDRTTIFYNPFRDVWVCSQRTESADGKRNRSYVEGTSAADLMSKVTYNDMDNVYGESVHWVGADPLDPRHTDPLHSHIEPELYNLDAMPYESIMIGQFAIWQGPRNGVCGDLWVQKRNDILLGFSRDGFHWDRPDRTRFIACTWDESSWRFGNVQSCVGSPLVVGDELYFYFNSRPKPVPADPGWDHDFHTGLATLRRDGFASMDATGTQTLTTRPVSFQGKYLFVNVDCPAGSLKVEVLNEASQVISPFTLANCDAISADTTLIKVTWGANDALSALAGQPIRFRFTLTDGSLYAFWVSPDASGASYGYVGGGGPGFTGPVDTVGQSAQRTSR